jgi:C-type mannose receptor
MKTRRPFDDAESECERMRGRLATIENATENSALLSAIGSPWGYGSGIWLGCSDAEKEGSWVCDGRPMAFTNWASGQPDNASALDDCAEWLSDTGQWNDLSCDRHLGFLCRGDASLRCTGRTVRVGSSVFCAHSELADWDGAAKACESSGGKLATIATREESGAIFEALKLPSAIPSWEPLEGVWIGLTDRAQEGSFQWVSHAPTRFARWMTGQPNDANGGEDCATFTLGDGTWNDADCGRPLPYVCELR